MPTIRYWAGAKAASGVETETVDGPTVGAVLDAAQAAHPELVPVLPHCAMLIDGHRVDRDQQVAATSTIEVLPPFAGG